MGQATSSETLSISGGDGYRYWVGINMKPFGKGCKKTVFKGVLLGSGPRQWEKVIAKAFTDIPGTKEIWSHEVNKADLTRQLAANFLQKHRGMCKISVVIPGIVQMDKVSAANNWYASKSGLRGLGRSEWISVEEFIPGRIFRFCQWKEEHTQDRKESEHLQTFSHFTYKHSCGTLVACDFQGTCDNSNSPAHYTFTDSIIHSSSKIYGTFDKGEFGITEFFKRHKCNHVCRDWPKPTPLTPPPSFDQACALQLHLTPPPAFENVVFSSHAVSHGEPTQRPDALNDSRNRRRRHASAHGARNNRETPADTLEVSEIPRRRRSVGSMDRGNTLGAPRECIPLSPPPPSASSPSQPPSYNSVMSADLRARSATFGGFEVEENDSHRSIPSCPDIELMSHPSSASQHNIRSLESHQQHLSLTATLSDPECRLRSQQARASPDQGDVAADVDRAAASNSSLRRRRMQSQRYQSNGSSQDNDMVSFYLGEIQAELPPLRVVPSAPPSDDACLADG